MVTCAIARDENSLQFILQLTEIDLWKYELLILEDMKMRKSFSEEKFLKKNMKILSRKGCSLKTWNSFPGKEFIKKT